MKYQLRYDPYYGEVHGPVRAIYELIEKLRCERPYDVKDAFLVAHPTISDAIAKYAYESQHWPPPAPPGEDEPYVLDAIGLGVRPSRDPSGRVTAPPSFAAEIRRRYTMMALGMEMRLTNELPTDLVELWVENDVDRAIRRGIEQFGEAKIVVANTRDLVIQEPPPPPTLRALLDHWRWGARDWIAEVIAKTRRQV